MMLGEIDFLNTYVHHSGTYLQFPIPAYIILILFMVLMPILLMNLLIGLAVGDIESVRRNAQLKRLAMQVSKMHIDKDLVYHQFERQVILHSELERKLPKMLLQKVTKNEIIEYPNDTKCKNGILDSILRKWFGNPFTDDGNVFYSDNGACGTFALLLVLLAYDVQKLVRKRVARFLCRIRQNAEAKSQAKVALGW